MKTSEGDDTPRRTERGGAPARRDPRRELEMVYHRVQMAVLTRLGLGPASAGELAEDTGLGLEVVRRELETLLGSGRVERIQGAGEVTEDEADFYRIDRRANVIFGEIDVPRQEYNEATMRLLATMFREALDALEAGTFESLYERCLARFPIPLDSRGLGEADEVHRHLVSEVLEEGERAALRLEESGEPPVHTITNILFFEHPLARWPSPLAEGEPRRRISTGERPPKILDMTDPFRMRLLGILMVTPRGLKDLVAELDAPSAKVRYELEQLLADGFISVLRREERRGTAERIFTAEPRRLMFSSEEMATLEGRSERYSRSVVRTIFGEAFDSIRVDSSREMDQMSVYRILLPLDVRGISRISKLMQDALERLVELRERCIRGLGKGEEPAHLAISHLLLYESAPVPRAGRKHAP